MTKKECKLILKVLEHIKNPDTYVKEAILNIKRDIERYDRMKGQLLDQYEYETSNW